MTTCPVTAIPLVAAAAAAAAADGIRSVEPAGGPANYAPQATIMGPHFTIVGELSPPGSTVQWVGGSVGLAAGGG